MFPVVKAITEWFRENRANGVVALLVNSEDPITTLRKLRQQIDESVIDKLLSHDFHVGKAEGAEKALSWADIALQASLIGGRAIDQAECVTWRGIFLQDLYEETSKTLPGQ